MHYKLTVNPHEGITCWPEGTDTFGPTIKAGTSIVVEYSGEQVTNPRNGMVFHIVSFWDKGMTRRFEVRADAVTLERIE